MNNQDTPETDAQRKMHHRTAMHTGTRQYHEYVLSDFSRKLERERNQLREVIRETLMENLHLADGDVCTLKRLKDAIGFELDSLENA